MRDVATLLEALPYIRQFHGKTVVIKYGGAAMTEPELKEEFARDVVLLKYVGMNPVIVHGGGPEITAYMERLDLPVQFVDGLRVSDTETVQIAKMVLVGKVNKDIVLLINRHGQPAVGLCGDDGLLFRAVRQAAPSGQDIGFVGRIEHVDVDVLNHVAQDYIPVVASVGADREGNSYNINADEAAGAVARALCAHKVMFLTDVAGWMRDPGDPDVARVARERRRGRRGSARRRRRHAAEARRLSGGHSRGRLLSAHRRRPGAPQPAARVVHRRRPGHHDRIRVAVSLSDLQQLERDYAIPTYVRNPVEFVRGSGTRLWDVDGNEYLDFLAGISVLNVGHCHPRIVAAVQDQAAKLTHVTNLYYTEPAMRLSGRLAQSSLGGKVFLCNSGAEANEAAIKLARRHRAGGGIVVFQGGFHGRTYGALSATPQETKQAPFAPLVPGFTVVPKDPEALARAVDDTTAAVLLEPIQGETGIHPLSEELLSAAREACDRTGAILIFDEIQTGMGRTGTLWAYEQTTVTPDAMTSAKALGGGLPIGALITSPALGDTFQPGDHGSTFAGGPLAARAALEALDICSDPQLLANVIRLGEHFAGALTQVPYVREVRGRGLMVAIDLADGVDAAAIARRALLEQRLVVNATGPGTIRLEPPLIVSEEELDEAAARLFAISP